VYCGQCGTPNHEESGHCETCGAPLLITTGARNCANCGASLGDHDRFCTSCGTAANGTEATQQYDAADDFGELDIDDIQFDELPDWLQSMAPSTPEESEPAAPTQQPTTDQPSPEDLPEWLREAPAASESVSPPIADPQSSQSATPPAREQGGQVDHQPADQFSLVSDEDLPDWLKALSDDDSDTPSPQPQPAQPAATSSSPTTTAVANLFEVPPVSRAWLTQGRFVDQDDVTAARQEFMPLEAVSGVSAEQRESHDIWETGPVEPPGEEQETRPFLLPHDALGGDRGKLIARIAILVLLVIVLLILGFLVLQGV
jgi:hypothetical protein